VAAGESPTDVKLADFLRDAAVEVEDVYKTRGWCWSRLRREAGLQVFAQGPEESLLQSGVRRLLHVDDPVRLALYRRAASNGLTADDLDQSTANGRALTGLHFALWGSNRRFNSLRQSFERLREHPAIMAELVELFDVLDDRSDHLPVPLDEHMGWDFRIPLAVHSRASLKEILAAFGRLTLDHPGGFREGVAFDNETSSDLFFVTIEKAERHYSPTTLYRDYAISPELFHWESQSTTSVESETGTRYLHHKDRGTNILLFVRHRKHESCRTAAYTFLGAADYVSHEGNRPIGITWRLRKAMPDDFFREARVAAA
jgi:uncharacterized protein DUF3427